MKYPMLYKKSSTGAIQVWAITVVGNTIGIMHGKLGGKMQTTEDVISKGKNVGKKNETTPAQQAEAEAQAKWEKQKKKGYVDNAQAAVDDEVDAIIEGGAVPMLAQKFSEQGHKIKLPCYVQPKLDGIRCIAIVKDGVCTLWSRTRKPITSCPHIIQELEAAFETKDIILDGELYNHEMKKDFEKIVSLVRQEVPAEGHEIVQYHVYDVINEGVYAERLEEIDTIFGNFEFYALKKVLTEPVNVENDIMIYFDQFRTQGYEGAMLRNEFSKYVNKRSYDLQKVKEFDDAEFEIIGIEEGRGKLNGHVGAFKCRTASGKEFLAKLRGDTEKLRTYFTDHSLWEGKRLTVQYQGITGKEGVPRFPVGVSIRDYE